MINNLSSKSLSLTPRSTNTLEKSEPFKNKTTINGHTDLKGREPKKEDQLTEVVESINKFLQASQTSLKFVLHEELNEYYVTVVDDITREVIKEIPSKKMLDMYAAMTEFVGLMVDKKI